MDAFDYVDVNVRAIRRRGSTWVNLSDLKVAVLKLQLADFSVAAVADWLASL